MHIGLFCKSLVSVWTVIFSLDFEVKFITYTCGLIFKTLKNKMVLCSCLNLPVIKGGFEMGHRTRFCENAWVCTVFLNSAFCCTVCTHTNAVRLRIFWSFFKVMQLKWKDLLKAGFQCMPQSFYVVEFSNRWCKTIIHFGKQAKMIVKNLTLFSRWSNVVFFQFRRIWVDNFIIRFECDCFV